MTQRSAALALLLLVASCETESAPKSLTAAPVSALPAAEPVPKPSIPPAFRGPRLRHASGEIASSAEVREEERAAKGQVFQLAGDGELELELASGARVQLRGPALLAVSARSDQGLLVRYGLLRVELPPGAAKPGARASWFASPALRVELPHAARFVLRVDADGRTQIAIVGGRVAIDLAESGPAASPTREVEPGHLVTAEPMQALVETQGPATLEAALAQLADKRSAAIARPRDLQTLLRPTFDALLSAAAIEAERSTALDQQHQALSARHDPAAAGVVRQIAEHAAQMFRSRRRLEASLARVEAAQVSLDAAPAPDPALVRATALLR